MEQAFTPLDGRLTIVLDRTGSMQHSINALKNFLPKYIIRRAGMGIESLCLVTFDDHYRGVSWSAGDTLGVVGPTDNLEEFMYGLSQVQLGDGDDYQEAIACALSLARKVHGGSIWLVTDSVPHGAPAPPSTPLFWGDSYPSGCPCGEKFDPSGVNVLLVKDSIGEAYDFWYQQTGGRVAKADLREILESDPLTSEMVTV